MLHWQTFPPEPPTAEALTLLRDAWRDVSSVDAEQGTLVAFNVVGYGAGLAVGKSGPRPMFSSAPATKEQIEAAFAAAIPGPGMRAGPAEAIPWNILLPVALDLLRKWLKF